MSVKLDLINQNILLAVQSNARLSVATIAENANISASPCHKRIKQLEKQGVVINYVANIDLSKVCESITFLTEVTLQENNTYASNKFEDAVKQEKTLIECYQVSGSYDYFARFVCRNIEDYKGVTDRLLAKSPVKSIQSHCMMSKVKRFSGYPLKHLLSTGGQGNCE